MSSLCFSSRTPVKRDRNVDSTRPEWMYGVRALASWWRERAAGCMWIMTGGRWRKGMWRRWDPSPLQYRPSILSRFYVDTWLQLFYNELVNTPMINSADQANRDFMDSMPPICMWILSTSCPIPLPPSSSPVYRLGNWRLGTNVWRHSLSTNECSMCQREHTCSRVFIRDFINSIALCKLLVMITCWTWKYVLGWSISSGPRSFYQ